MNAIEALTYKLNRLMIDEACWLAEVYQCDKAELLHRDAATGATKRICMADLPESRDLVAFARSEEVGFWGGPPEGENFYFGTVVTFLIDNILRAQVRDGTGFAWLLTFDDGSKKTMQEQLAHHLPDAYTQKLFWDAQEVSDCPFLDDTYNDPYYNPVVEHIQVGDISYPIHEDGSQGCIAKRVGEATPHRSASEAMVAKDDGAIYPHSSSVRIRVRV